MLLGESVFLVACKFFLSFRFYVTSVLVAFWIGRMNLIISNIFYS